MRAILTITVDYTEESPAAEIKEQLSQLAIYASNNGLLSGTLEATVEDWSQRIDFLEPSVAGYLDSKGGFCPHCGSDNIESTSGFDADGPVGTMDIKCNNCGAFWEDVFRLVTYRDLESD